MGWRTRRQEARAPAAGRADQPPRALGKYGGDVDNWMWPRHTGDFARAGGGVEIRACLRRCGVSAALPTAVIAIRMS